MIVWIQYITEVNLSERSMKALLGTNEELVILETHY
jgi:hypothetical protein